MPPSMRFLLLGASALALLNSCMSSRPPFDEDWSMWLPIYWRAIPGLDLDVMADVPPTVDPET